MCSHRVPTAQGKQGKWQKMIPCQGKHREFGTFVKTQGKHREFGLLKLILKVKDISIFAAKSFLFFFKAVCQVSFLYKGNSHKSCKLAQEKFAVGQGINKENTGNLKMQFEWVPCHGPQSR